MIPRTLSRPAQHLALLAASFIVAGCEKVPLLAPTGSTITLTSATTALPINGTATIIAQVLESSGTPPHSGTRVTFTTTLGTIEPSEASTDTSGRVTVTFNAGTASGVAIIGATSGGATTSAGGGVTTGTGGGGTTGGGTTSGDRSLRIAVGAAAVGRVSVSANPTSLSATGGASTITAHVVDINGNALSSTPVTFTTTAGTLSAATVTTDAGGVASTVLTTFQPATVTATVGAGSSNGSGGGTTGGGTTGGSNTQGSVTVSLLAQPTASIALVGTSLPAAGLPSTFTIRVTPATAGGSGGGTGGGGTIAIRDVTIDWGDGSGIRNLGSISGEQSIAHVYARSGVYTVTLTVTDVAGSMARVATTVTVIPIPTPSVIVTPTPASAPGGSSITFRIETTVAPGLDVTRVEIDFGYTPPAPQQTQVLGGGTGTKIATHIYPAGVKVYVVTVSVTVRDAAGTVTTYSGVGTATVSITT
jgi:hypothetical protein